MPLSVGQMTYNGITIGPGGVAQLVDVTGLTGLPANRSSDLPRPNAQGMLGGYDFMGTRSVTANVEVTATGGNAMPVNLETLRKALLMQTAPSGGMNPAAAQVLTFNLGQGSGGVGVNRRIAARCRKFEDKVDIQFAGGGFVNGLAQVALLLEAADPNIYDATTQTASVGLSVTTGGLTFAATPPFTFGTQSGGLITAVNNGTVACPPYMTITGPCQNPRVQQQTTGVTLKFNTTLNTGDTLAIDCWALSAVLNGVVNRTNTLAPGSYISTFTIPPGSNTIAFYSSDSSSTTAQLTVNWANTWA